MRFCYLSHGITGQEKQHFLAQKFENFLIYLSFNIRFGFSKEPSH